MAVDRFKPLLDRSYLRGELDYFFRDYLAEGHDAPLLERLQNWLKRDLKKETQAEGAFVQRFFVETWGYVADGGGAPRFNLHPQFAVEGAGQTGGKGKADLANLDNR